MGLTAKIITTALLTYSLAKGLESQLTIISDSSNIIQSEYVLPQEQDSLTIPRKSTNPIVNEAQKYLGIEYEWDGRNTKNNPGMDCLGLVDRAYSAAKNQDWTKYPTNPWEMVSKETFGSSVKGLDGVLTKDINYNLLKEGDIIHLMSEIKARSDWKPIKKINNEEHYGHHIGIYIGNGKWIHANPYFNPAVVLIQDLKHFLDMSGFSGIYVTRPKN